MLRKAAILIFLLVVVSSSIFAETLEDTIEPKGVYATIDTQASIQAIDILNGGTDAEKAAASAVILANSDKYCPALFFHLAAYLFNTGKTDDALFWLYAGRIRTQYDMKRCTDESVAGGYEELNALVPDLLKLGQFEDIEKTKKIVERAIEWDKNTPHNYDPRWIALHGMGSYMRAIDDNSKKEPVLTIPENEWEALAEKNREVYWDAFVEDMDAIKPDQLEGIKEKIRSLQQTK